MGRGGYFSCVNSLHVRGKNGTFCWPIALLFLILFCLLIQLARGAILIFKFDDESSREFSQPLYFYGFYNNCFRFV